MFDLQDRPRVWIAVKWPGLVPDDVDGLAKAVEHVVELQVEIIDRGEMKALFITDDNDIKRATSEAVMRVVSDWRKVLNGGKPLKFTPDSVARMLDYPGFDAAFPVAYLAAWGGQAETRAGNFGSSPSGGPADDQSTATKAETA